MNFGGKMNSKLGVYLGWRWMFLGVCLEMKEVMGKGKEKGGGKEIVLNV